LKNLIELPLEAGGTVFVEVDDLTNRPMMRGVETKQVGARVVATFEDALASLRPAVEAVVLKFKDLDVAPQQVGIEFGVKFTADAKAYIASASAEANFKVTLSWKHEVLS